MFVFLFISLTTFLVIGGLIAARQQILIRSGTRYLRITIKGLAKVYVRQIAVIIGIGVLLATLLGGLTFLVVSKALPIYHELYKTQEFLTSDLFTKGLLGFLFGGVLAIWLARIYHVKPDAKLTFVQKLGGIAILVLFVLGTTTITIEEFIRGLRIDGTSLKFGLQAALPNGEGKSVGSGAVAADPKSDEMSTDRSFKDGFGLILGTHRAMSRDADYMTIFVKDENWKPLLLRHGSIRDEFDARFEPLIACIRNVLSTTGDKRYLFSQLSPLRATLGAVYLNLQTNPPNTAKAVVGPIEWSSLNVSA